AFILPRTNLKEGKRVAERIRSDIAELKIPIEGTVLRVSASIGIAAYPESDPLDLDDLVARADVALYEAKRRGKDRVCVAESKARSDGGELGGTNDDEVTSPAPTH